MGYSLSGPFLLEDLAEASDEAGDLQNNASSAQDLHLLLTIRLIGLKSEHRCAAPAKGEKEPQESSINNAID